MQTRIPPFLKPLLESPVAILGAGVSGRAVCDLLKALGASGHLFDEHAAPGNANIQPVFDAQAAASHRLVVFSPGFPPGHPWLTAARAAGCTCLGEVDFASLFWRGSLIAITGTNGKTTLTEFLTHALRSISRDVTATGNIGLPLATLVTERGGGGPESIAVCEISSFQAETLRYFHADSAIWINFAEDHLERHPSIEEYFHAKWRLFERCIGGHVYAGSSVQAWADRLGQILPDDARIPTENQPGDILLRGTAFAEYPQRENFLLAAAWWHGQGLREGALYAAARTFTLADHRLQKIATTRPDASASPVTWWDDSKATNFHAVEAALSAFPAPVIVILGGKPKGGDIPAFVRRIAPRVRHALLIGETAPVLSAAALESGLAHTGSATLEQAVADAAALARPGEHVLLSPGFASFDQFRGYADRGLRFVQFVNKLGATPASID